MLKEFTYDVPNIERGYANQTLYVNLDNNEIKIKPVDDKMKETFTGVDAQSLLATVEALPIRQWNYLATPGVAHVGPTAEDFYAAFGLGGDEQSIGTVDADGVALAAIQGLHQIVKEKEKELDDAKVRIAALEELVQSLVK